LNETDDDLVFEAEYFSYFLLDPFENDWKLHLLDVDFSFQDLAAFQLF